MLERRLFLRGLASLPLIGGSVALIGAPTAAAVPVTDQLLDRYAAWIAWEHAEVIVEQEARSCRADPHEAEFSVYRARHRREWAQSLYRCPDDPVVRRSVLSANPSTRAAVILSAAGVPLTRGACNA